MSADGNRALGCMFGGAFGDSLGASVEFATLVEILFAYGVHGILWPAPAYGLPAGVITDDTQQAIAVGDGLARAVSRGLTSDAILDAVWDALKAWHATQDDPGQRRAPGNTSMAGLSRRHRPSPASPVRNNSDSCGALMRSHAVGILYAGQSATAFQVGLAVAALTHGGMEAQLSAAAFSAMVAELMVGSALLPAIMRAISCVRAVSSQSRTAELLERACRMARDPSRHHPNELGEGWMGDEALAIAVYCSLVHEGDFLAGVRAAVNIDGDSDSTGSVCGALLGAMLGLDAIPREWRHRLERRGDLSSVAITLASVEIAPSVV